jgi:hypothetical protein
MQPFDCCTNFCGEGIVDAHQFFDRCPARYIPYTNTDHSSGHIAARKIRGMSLKGSNGGVLMTRYVFFACILTLVSYTEAANVLNQFVLTGSQCATAVSVNANGSFATSVIDQNGTGVLLFNPDLTLKFKRRFTSNGTLSPSSIAPTADGGFVVAGTISVPSGDTDAILFKVSSAGNIVWKKIFGTPENDELHSLTVLQDGSIAVLGHRISSSTSYDLLIARFSKGGALLWRKVLGTPSLDHAGTIASARGPALMVSAGTGQSPIQPLWIKLSLSGAVQSARVGSTRESAGIFYLENPNGGYYLGSVGPLVQGELSKTNISRFDATDRLVWAKSYALSGNQLTAFPGFVNPDGSMVLGGNAYTPSTSKGVVMKISSSGVVQWKRTLNVAQSIFNGPVQQTDGSIFTTGCVGVNTQASDIVALSIPLSGNTRGCSRLTAAPISAARTSMTLSNFSIAVLPATFHIQTAAIQAATTQPTKSALCP